MSARAASACACKGIGSGCLPCCRRCTVRAGRAWSCPRRFRRKDVVPAWCRDHILRGLTRRMLLGRDRVRDRERAGKPAGRRHD